MLNVVGSYELVEDKDYKSNINFKINEVEIVAHNEEVAGLFNSISFCGASDWYGEVKSFKEECVARRVTESFMLVSLLLAMV